MAAEATENKGGTAGLIAAVAGFAFFPILLVVFLAVGLFGVKGPNAQGATSPQPITVTSPEAQTLISSLQRYNDPQAFLQANSDTINQVLKETKDLKDATLKHSPQSASDTQIEGIADRMITDLQTIQADFHSDPSKATAAASDFFTQRGSLASLLNLPSGPVQDNIIKWAKFLADYNTPDPFKLPYEHEGHADTPLRIDPTTHIPLNRGIDCSGYMNYIFLEAGIFKSPSQAYANVDLYSQYAATGQFGFSYVPGYGPGNDKIPASQLVSDNKLKPGDLLIIKNRYGNHVAMYIGGSDPHKNTVESKSHSKGGPQYSSLASQSDVVAVAQPPGI